MFSLVKTGGNQGGCSQSGASPTAPHCPRTAGAQCPSLKQGEAPLFTREVTPGDFTLVPAFASIRDESSALLHMPTLSTDKSQIRPGNHRASIIHAGLLLGFPSLLKPVLSGARVCACAHEHEPEAQFHLKEEKKRSMLRVSWSHVALETGELTITTIFRGQKSPSRFSPGFALFLFLHE